MTIRPNSFLKHARQPCACHSSVPLMSATLPDRLRHGSPWENPYIESFNGRLRKECLNRYSFINGQEAQQILEHWRLKYNLEPPHSSLGYLISSEFAGRVSPAPCFLSGGSSRIVSHCLSLKSLV